MLYTLHVRSGPDVVEVSCWTKWGIVSMKKLVIVGVIILIFAAGSFGYFRFITGADKIVFKEAKVDPPAAELCVGLNQVFTATVYDVNNNDITNRAPAAKWWIGGTPQASNPNGSVTVSGTVPTTVIAKYPGTTIADGTANITICSTNCDEGDCCVPLTCSDLEVCGNLNDGCGGVIACNLDTDGDCSSFCNNTTTCPNGCGAGSSFWEENTPGGDYGWRNCSTGGCVTGDSCGTNQVIPGSQFCQCQ